MILWVKHGETDDFMGDFMGETWWNWWFYGWFYGWNMVKLMILWVILWVKQGETDDFMGDFMGETDIRLSVLVPAWFLQHFTRSWNIPRFET